MILERAKWSNTHRVATAFFRQQPRSLRSRTFIHLEKIDEIDDGGLQNRGSFFKGRTGTSKMGYRMGGNSLHFPRTGTYATLGMSRVLFLHGLSHSQAGWDISPFRAPRLPLQAVAAFLLHTEPNLPSPPFL